jgi:hypothetical protein
MIGTIKTTRELDARFYGSLPSAAAIPAAIPRKLCGQHGSAVVGRNASAGKGVGRFYGALLKGRR